MGQGLLNSQEYNQDQVKDELENAVGEVSTSGIMSLGMLDEIKNDPF